MQFDMSMVQSRPLITLYSKSLQVLWMRQYAQSEVDSSLDPTLQSVGVNSCNFAQSERYIVSQLYHSSYQQFTIIVIKVSTGEVAYSFNLADNNKQHIQWLYWNSFAKMPR